MAASYYDIPLINHWGLMKIVYKKEKKMYIVKSNDDDEALINEDIKEPKQTQMGQYMKGRYIKTGIFTTLVKSGYHIVAVENLNENGQSIGKRVPLARCQNEFAEKHKTWEVDVERYKKKILINLETKEVYADGVFVTVGCALGTTVFHIEGHPARLEDKEEIGWVLEVKDSQVKSFQPRNGPGKS